MSVRYISDTPCKRGHLGERYTRTSNCCECERIRSSQRAVTEKHRAYQRAYLKRRYQTDPSYREKKRSIQRRLYNKSGRILESVNRRYAAKKNATPVWLTEAHIEEMRVIYLAAKMLSGVTGVRMDVDHMVPLNGENVCGLHVPWNLQIVPASYNRHKKNRLMPIWRGCG